MNDTISNEFNIYLSYPMDRNNKGRFLRSIENYINIGTELKAYLIDWEKMDGLPKANLYVPAEHEMFIHRAYTNGLLTNEEISSINCEIVQTCNLLLLFGAHNLSTKIVEVECAKRYKVPIYTMPDLFPTAIQALRFAITVILKSGE